MLQTTEPLEVVDLTRGEFNQKPFFTVFVRSNPRDAALRMKCSPELAKDLEAKSGQRFHDEKDYEAHVLPFRVDALVGIEQQNKTQKDSDRVTTAISLRMIKAKLATAKAA